MHLSPSRFPGNRRRAPISLRALLREKCPDRMSFMTGPNGYGFKFWLLRETGIGLLVSGALLALPVRNAVPA